jgi:hypothetical protein
MHPIKPTACYLSFDTTIRQGSLRIAPQVIMHIKVLALLACSIALTPVANRAMGHPQSVTVVWALAGRARQP